MNDIIKDIVEEMLELLNEDREFLVYATGIDMPSLDINDEMSIFRGMYWINKVYSSSAERSKEAAEIIDDLYSYLSNMVYWIESERIGEKGEELRFLKTITGHATQFVITFDEYKGRAIGGAEMALNNFLNDFLNISKDWRDPPLASKNFRKIVNAANTETGLTILLNLLSNLEDMMYRKTSDDEKEQ